MLHKPNGPKCHEPQINDNRGKRGGSMGGGISFCCSVMIRKDTVVSVGMPRCLGQY